MLAALSVLPMLHVIKAITVSAKKGDGNLP